MDLKQSLKKVEEHLRPLYRKHWHTIQKSSKRGIIKDVHHYPLLSGKDQEIATKLNNTLLEYTGKIKINVAFGFVLRKGFGVKDELRFFHPSNNTMLFPTPRVIANAADRQKLEKDIEQSDGFTYAQSQRPSTEWTVESLMCVRFDVFKM